MAYTWSFVLSLVLPFAVNVMTLRVGVGRADVTGPAAEINFMGYGIPQKGTGVHLRQFSRAFIFDNGSQRLAFISVDSSMMGYGVKKKVIEVVTEELGDNIYDDNNVMLSSTHTHSTPGGHLLHFLFDVPGMGFCQETFNAYVTGIAKSLIAAHNNLQVGTIHISKGELLDASVNRSPTAYENNPMEEQERYKYNVDKDMVMLKVRSSNGTPLGAIVWFAVHPTSMNNTNTLISSDNVGLASVLLEQYMNPDQLIGKGAFVGAFASTNLGDVSPNTQGPRCVLSGLSCDVTRSTCDTYHGQRDECISSGPGRDMFDSTRIIADKLFHKAKELMNDCGFEVKGTLKVAHQYIDMPTVELYEENSAMQTSKLIKGCMPAMGYSFGAGTTDGPGVSFLSQSHLSADNALWNTLRDAMATTQPEDVACHAPKPILIPSGRMNFPYDWSPRIVSTQLVLFENLALVCAPGELTTMAGRRLRQAVTEVAPYLREVIIVGLCNTYSDYVTTYEEYQVQRYEGASTLFGPHTLDIYLNAYKNLTKALLEGDQITRGPVPADLLAHVVSLIPPVIYDRASWSHDFGNVTQQPPTRVSRGQTVHTRFVSGHPRNDLKHGDTFLTVERLADEDWTVVATDANWETKFHWIRMSDFLGTSEVEVEWTIPEETVPGEYRIRHFGVYKYILGGRFPYHGATHSFHVS